MQGHLHILHLATRQQHHLQVEQVGLQEAARPGGVEGHPGRDKHWNPAAGNEGNNQTYPCCVAILSSRHLMMLKEETETKRKTELNRQPVQVDHREHLPLPFSTCWSRSIALQRGSRGLKRSPDGSYGGTKGRRNNGPVVSNHQVIRSRLWRRTSLHCNLPTETQHTLFLLQHI